MTAEKIEWPKLIEGEAEVTAGDELVYRQVHPKRYHEGIVSSEAFEPGSSDHKCLSCSRSTKVSAAEATKHHVGQLHLTSAGCCAVSVAEVRSTKPITPDKPDVAALRVVDDSATAAKENPLPPGHCYLDNRPYGGSRITKKAKQLAFYANKRGGLIYAT